MNLRKKVKKNKLFIEHLSIISKLLDISPRETEVLSLLMELDYKWKAKLTTDVKNILSTDNRRLIMQETRVNKNNLSKYIAVLKSKGLLIKNSNGGYEVLSSLFPNIEIDNNGNEIVETLFTLVIEDE